MDITVRPITPEEIDRVPLRCWPNSDTIAKLFLSQGTIGMAAWEGDWCVAQLHCYRINCPDNLVSNWPRWNRPWWVESVQTGKVQLQYPAWCYACFHVGRTLQTDHEEFLALVQRFAQKTKWDINSIYEKLNSLDAVYLSRDQVNRAIRELRSSKREGFNTEAPKVSWSWNWHGDVPRVYQIGKEPRLCSCCRHRCSQWYRRSGRTCRGVALDHLCTSRLL